MSRDTNFYYSFLVLPPRKRRAIVAVWDFCRAVDDAVDEVVPESEWAGGLSDAARVKAAARLDGWRTELAAVYAGTPTTPQGTALAPFVTEFNLPRQRFEDLVDGVEMDLEHLRYDTFAELVEYCRRVASAVGLICLDIFGYRNPRSQVYAENLGLALQLTNIIRDVRGDLARGRIYLPTEDLERFGVTESDLRAGSITPPLAGLLQFQCDRAHSYYRRAAEQLPPEDARSLVAAEIMRAIYFDILRRIEQNGYDVFTTRVRVPRPVRAMIALRLWIMAILGIHNAELRMRKKR